MELKRIILLYNFYSESASFIRMVALAKGYVSAGLEVVFVIKTSVRFRKISIQGVRIILLEDNTSLVNLPQKLLNLRRLKRTVDEFYDDNTAIHIYGINYQNLLFTKRKYRCCYEITEVPFYSDAHETITYYLQEAIKTPISKKATGLFVISRNLQDYFHKRGVSKICVLNMIVDGERFTNVKEKPENRISYCGSVSLYKDGVDILLRAFAIVNKKYPDYKLVIIGGYYDDETKGVVDSLLVKLNLSNKVEITGKLSPESVPNYLYRSQLLVLARPDNKQAKYGFPTKVGEYLCTKRPVLLTDVGCINDFFRHKENALICRPGDIQELADNIIWVIEHPADAEIIGRNGFRLTKESFSNEIEALKAIKYIESLD